jgi:hypothetical protein
MLQRQVSHRSDQFHGNILVEVLLLLDGPEGKVVVFVICFQDFSIQIRSSTESCEEIGRLRISVSKVPRDGDEILSEIIVLISGGSLNSKTPTREKSSPSVGAGRKSGLAESLWYAGFGRRRCLGFRVGLCGGPRGISVGM